MFYPKSTQLDWLHVSGLPCCIGVYVHLCTWECLADVLCQVTENWPVAAVHVCMCVCTHICTCTWACHMLSHVCVCVCVYVCVCAYIMLLLTCFSYNCNLFKHFFLFVFLNSFVHSHVTLMVCFKANFLLRTIKYYIYLCRHAHTHMYVLHTYTHMYLLHTHQHAYINAHTESHTRIHTPGTI